METKEENKQKTEDKERNRHTLVLAVSQWFNYQPATISRPRLIVLKDKMTDRFVHRYVYHRTVKPHLTLSQARSENLRLEGPLRKQNPLTLIDKLYRSYPWMSDTNECITYHRHMKECWFKRKRSLLCKEDDIFLNLIADLNDWSLSLLCIIDLDEFQDRKLMTAQVRAFIDKDHRIIFISGLKTPAGDIGINIDFNDYY